MPRLWPRVSRRIGGARRHGARRQSDPVLSGIALWLRPIRRRMVITVLTSRLLRLFASRTRLTVVLGTVIAGAAIGVPVTADAAVAATGAQPGAVASSHAAPFPATV